MNFYPGLEPFDQRMKREQVARDANAVSPLAFGVSFLDDALGGIYPNDLILLGAKTGFGKTQLATLIALKNAALSKRVMFLALEAEPFEIERRIKYQMICDRFFSLQGDARPNIRLNYMDWYYGKFSYDLKRIESEIDSMPEVFPSLSVFYRESDFGAQQFEQLLTGRQAYTDLIVVDHLHYFDLEDDNENRAMKSLVKKIRDVSLLIGKPILLLAHVRKSDKRSKQLIPDIEDFHGSSDIGKIATKAITIAPSYDMADPKKRKTYMQVLKCRVDGARTAATAVTAFNFTTQKYESSYFMGKLSNDGTQFEPFSENEIPPWAIHAKAAVIR